MSLNRLIFVVAEKEMGLRAPLVETLRGMGFANVLPAANGAQAWSLINGQGAAFVIAAWNLSDITGLDLLKIMRSHRRFRRIPFILLSEIPTKQQAMDSAAAGVNDFMCRPLIPQRLKERIDALLTQTFDQQGLQAQILYQEGLAAMNKGAWDKALQAMSASARGQEDAEVFFHLGRILTKLERPQEAIAVLTRAVVMDPFFRRAAQKLGEALLAQGRDQEAQPHLERAVEIFLAQAQDPESAMAVFKEPWQSGSDYFSVFDSLGVIYRRTGHYPEAIALYNKALRINPQDGNIHHHIGRAHYETGDYGEAMKALKKALELSPGLTEAQKLYKIVAAKVTAAG